MRKPTGNSCRPVQGVCVQAPASTANLGPGFDVLGLALARYNLWWLERQEANWPKESLPSLVREAADFFFQTTGIPPFPIRWQSLREEIPQARGLGSSAAVRVGVLAGLCRLTGHPWDRRQIALWAAELEGHPDNAAPAALGGFVACAGQELLRAAVSDRLRLVLFIPVEKVSTEHARTLLPTTVPLSDAVANLGRAVILAGNFFQGRGRWDPTLFEDRWHQPARTALLPYWNPLREAALQAGAQGFWLSGSGPTLVALAINRSKQVARAMEEAARRNKICGEIQTVGPDHRGVRVLRTKAAPPNG
jgi:homoserine kinase